MDRITTSKPFPPWSTTAPLRARRLWRSARSSTRTSLLRPRPPIEGIGAPQSLGQQLQQLERKRRILANFEKVGLFDSELRFAEDTDWFNRALEVGLGLERVAQVTLHVRRHGENLTRGKSLVELSTLRVFKKALDRKRQGTTEDVVR